MFPRDIGCLLPILGKVRMFDSRLAALLATLICSMTSSYHACLADEASAERRTVQFAAKNNIERFKLGDHQFNYELQWRDVESERFQAANVTFPSPVETDEPANNTVHCEYYLPKQPGKRPAVIVL